MGRETMVNELKERRISVFILSLAVHLKFILHHIKENINFLKLKEYEFCIVLKTTQYGHKNKQTDQ